MLRLASSTEAAIDLSVTDEAVLRRRVVVPWRGVVVLAALCALVVAGVLSSGFVGRQSSVSVARPSVSTRAGLGSLPVTALGPISGALGGDESAFRVAASGSGFRASSPRQHLRLQFGSSGVFLRSGVSRVGLSLDGVGYGSSLGVLAHVRPRARDSQVVYRYPGLTEVYVNGPLGLEQRFTVSRGVSHVASGPLTLAMSLSGDVRASVASGGQGVVLSHPGAPAISYDDLLVRDARGRVLHSWFTSAERNVLVHVNLRGARWPITVDPLIHLAKLTGGEEVGKAEFGEQVALSSNGTTAAIGGPGDNESRGAIWVYARSGTTWTQQAKLTGGAEEDLGANLALSANGSTLVSSTKSTRIYTRSEGKWSEPEKLASEPGCEAESVAISGNGTTIVLGDPNYNSEVGSACVFVRSEGKWVKQGGLLTGSEEVGPGRFGRSVALSYEGTTALIGGPHDDYEPGSKSDGAVWAFTRSGETWTHQGAKITGGPEEIDTHYYPEAGFGAAVSLSLSGNTALVSAPGDDDYAGAGWILTRSEETWTRGPKLVEKDERGNSEFPGSGYIGESASLSPEGDYALLGGGENETTYFGETPGTAVEFAKSGEAWSQVGQKLTSGERGENGQFGESVAISERGEFALVGGYGMSENVGAAWVFTLGFDPEELYGRNNEAEPNQFRACVGRPVNCATGNQIETQTDLTVGGRGPGLSVTRTSNSRLAATQHTPGPFGYGWTASYGASLTVDEENETATVTQDNASTATFDQTSSKTYVAAGPWVEGTLVKEGSTYVFTLPDQTKLDFNSAGKLTSETDRDGNAITLAYNGSGQLETATDGAGRKLTFTYNGEGFVESVKDPMGHVVKYTYESGNLATVTQPGETSLRWQFKYNSEHEVTFETDGRGNTTATEYNSQDQVIAQIEPLERKRTWEYTITEYGEPETTIHEPNGAVTVEHFNEERQPTIVTHAYGTSLAATTTYEYNEANELIAVTDPDKHTTKYGYDAEGDRTSMVDPNGDETKWTYDKTHDIETETTPKGEKTTYKREAHGNPEVIERPAPSSKVQKTTYKYNSKGDITSETNPLEQTRTYEYDTYGDRESETDPEGNKRTWKYNEDSQEIATVSPRKYETKIERNDQGMPVKVTNPLGQTTKYVYDGDGNTVEVTDGNGHTTTYTYNADNELTATKEPNGATTETEYDSEGEPVAQTNGNKHTTKYVRSLLEQVTELVEPLGRKTSEEYDAAGNVKKVTDPEKRTTTYTYDPGNRLTESAYSEEGTHAVKYEYDKDGSIVKMVDGTGTTKYTYDQLERLTETENGHKEKAKYEYNLGNEPTKITYPNGKAITRAYDKDARLDSVTDWSSHVTKFTYNPDSEPASTVFPTETKDEDKYSYNEADQMSEVKMAKSTETLASLAYTRDNDGQVKKTTSTGLPGEATLEDTYDEDNRLTKAGTTAYEYDPANDPTKEGSSTNTYNEGNELEKGTSTSYSYNEVGQRSKLTPEKGPATTYAYNQVSDLTSVKRPKEGEVASIEDSYTYDGNGLRASQTIAGTTTYLAWDLAESVPLLLTDGTNSYIYGPEDLPIEQISSGGTITYLHHDQAGSTRLMTGSTGTVTGKCSYGAYGAPTCEGTTTTPLGYDAQYTSTDTGLIYMRARTYDPTTAQFLTIDPLEATTRAPYTYANDDPLSFGDPSGLLSFGEVVSGIEAGVHAVGSGLNEAGKAIASVGKYAAPALDVVAGGVCVVATDGLCGVAIASNFVAQQALVVDQALYDPDYNWAANEAAIVAGTGLGAAGLGAVASSELGGLGRAALGASVSSPAWILDATEAASTETASAASLTCQ